MNLPATAAVTTTIVTAGTVTTTTTTTVSISTTAAPAWPLFLTPRQCHLVTYQLEPPGHGLEPVKLVRAPRPALLLPMPMPTALRTCV